MHGRNFCHYLCYLVEYQRCKFLLKRQKEDDLNIYTTFKRTKACCEGLLTIMFQTKVQQPPLNPVIKRGHENGFSYSLFIIIIYLFWS